MNKIFAQVSYTFNNFYNNLNRQGQIIFTIIVGLILILFILLFVTYLIQKVKTKRSINKLTLENDTKEEVSNFKNSELLKDDTVNTKSKSEVEDIARRVEDALNDTMPISLTSFEEDQERTAIISIDELMKRAKELQIIDDEQTGVNYLEKYNLNPKEVEEVTKNTMNQEKKEVKAFKVSQVISPIYGIKKDVMDDDD